MELITEQLKTALESVFPAMSWLYDLWVVLYSITSWISFDLDVGDVGVNCKAAQVQSHSVSVC